MIDNDVNEQEVALTEIETDTVKKGKLSYNKMYFIIFWVIFFLLIVLITIKCVLSLSDKMTLNGAFIEKQYTTQDIESLTSSIEEQLEAENSRLHTAYGLDMELLPTYQVYSSEDGSSAMVIYTLKFNGRTYTIVGYTHSNYYNGLNSIIEYRNELISTGNYTWDNSYIPEEDEVLPEITPTEPPTHTEDGTPITSEIDSEDEVIERGGGEED